MFAITFITSALCASSLVYGAWSASSYLYDVCRGYGPRQKYKIAKSVDYLEQTLTENNISFDIVNHDSDTSVLIAHANKLAVKLKVLDFCKTIVMLIELSAYGIGKTLNTNEIDFLQNAMNQHYPKIVKAYELLEHTTYLGMYDTLIRVIDKVHKSVRYGKTLCVDMSDYENKHVIQQAEILLSEVIYDLFKKLKHE